MDDHRDSIRVCRPELSPGCANCSKKHLNQLRRIAAVASAKRSMWVDNLILGDIEGAIQDAETGELQQEPFFNL